MPTPTSDERLLVSQGPHYREAFCAGLRPTKLAVGLAALAGVALMAAESHTIAGGAGARRLLEVSDFAYHKDLLPLDSWDGAAAVFASLGLIIAAGGGIGGGGILVPIYILVLSFLPKHAIALANVTIFGGAIANTCFNAGKTMEGRGLPLIDWDIIVVMEPLTIFGAVVGTVFSKVLPNIVLTTSLVVVLAYMGQRTMKKGFEMWRKETRLIRGGLQQDSSDMEAELTARAAPCSVAREQDAEEVGEPYLEMQSEPEGPCGPEAKHGSQALHGRVTVKIAGLILCFAGTCALTLLKGGGKFESPFGVECGSAGFWALELATLPWVFAFAICYRCMLIAEFETKVASGYRFASDEVKWDRENTIRYPAICAVAGLFAGLFGVGGGIIKGPLLLEMGVPPPISSASAAAMILFTSATASTSFGVFGLLHPGYAAAAFLMGLGCTAAGQHFTAICMKRSKRQSPIVLSIGSVITLSTVLVAVNTLVANKGKSPWELFAPEGICASVRGEVH